MDVRAIVLRRDDGLYWAGADKFTDRLDEAAELDDDGAIMAMSTLKIKYPSRSFSYSFVG